MLLYLARHAQTASSAIDSYNGRRELPLTAEGRAQASALFARLRGMNWAAVYRSPLGRTAETAALVAPAVAATVLPGLVEIDYGEWEGLSVEQARANDPARYAAFLEDPARTGPPGGETAAQVAARALAAIEQIRALHEDAKGPVLAISHKATLRILAAALFGGSVSEYRTRWAQDECALDLFELRTGKPAFLRLWNDTAHLGKDPGASTRAAR